MAAVTIYRLILVVVVLAQVTAWMSPHRVQRSSQPLRVRNRVLPITSDLVGAFKAARCALKNSNGNNQDQIFEDRNRRKLWIKTVTQVFSVGLGTAALASLTSPVWARSSEKRSRTDGYKIQKSEQEWREQLSDLQYNILRQGGTERPFFSILEGEKRPGIFMCAGCGTELFASADKFRSGTGWPSFARGLPGVEIENVDPVKAAFAGAELRCGTCGGHLGDVFSDGKLFVGTVAFETGKRFCIDGAALVFYPDDGGDPVRGDVFAKASSGLEQPDWLSPPKISTRERES